MAALTARTGIPISMVKPKYLHSNSTSHIWPFSAIAELIDNGFDAKAKQFWIDKKIFRGQICLVFMDSGLGMVFDEMHKMLSFGFNNKERVGNHLPLGRYGNGFKSSSMRLGKDAIVLSRRGNIMCVGLLSQTYLEDINAENVIVPIITFTPTGQTFDVESAHKESLHDILKYSLFNTKEELLNEIRVIGKNNSPSTGTRIIIWNLRNKTESISELDFSQERDIRIPDNIPESLTEQTKWQDTVPESEYSLRAYCSILYLKPKMQIIIQGQKIKTVELSKSLAQSEKYRYKPSFLNHQTEIMFGYNKENTDHYGVMMYHNNRLIKAYQRLPCQRRANSIGSGVTGLIDCSYLHPTHNKQDFIPTDEYRKTIQTANTKLIDYCKNHQTNKDIDESHQNLSEGVQKKQTVADVKSPRKKKDNKKPNVSTRCESSSADPPASEACSSKIINITDSEDDEAVMEEDDNNSEDNQINKGINSGDSEKSQDHELQFQQDKEETNQLQHEQEQLDEKNPSSSIPQTVTDVKNPRKKKAENIDILENKKPKVTSRCESSSADPPASEACSSKNINITDSEDDEAVMQENGSNSGNNQINKGNNSEDSGKSQDHELQFQQDKEQPNQLQHEQEQLDEKMNSVEYDHSMVSSQKSLESDCNQAEQLNEGQEDNNLQACMNGLNELRQHVVMVLSNFIPPLNHQQKNRVCDAINEICREVTDGNMAST